MNLSAVFHRPLSEYAFAESETRYVFRLRAQAGDIKRCTFRYTDRAEMTAHHTYFSLPMPRVREDKLYDWFEITLDTEFSRIAYCFELYDGEKTVYYAGECFEDEPEEICSYLFQLPYNHRADRLVIPEWVKDAVVYNIFPDSFASGRRRIEDKPLTLEYEGENCSSRHGGTVNGIRENLDYIQALGCNCLYLNPFFCANSWHKYDIVDYKHVDPTRGTDEDFRALVREAHERGMRVIIDGVFNHISSGHPFFRDVLEKGRTSEYYGCFYDVPEKVTLPENGEAPGYACFCYVPEMPKTDTSEMKMHKYFCDVGAYWVREFDVDGWRLDVANEVDDGFLRDFRSTVKEEKADALVIGEVWENAFHYFNGNMMDSAMNYDFRRFCTQFFADKRIDAAEFDLRISSLLMRCKRQAGFAQLNLLDSHDVSRFLTVCGESYDIMEQAVLFQMCFVGMPSIFYGDEKGLTGLVEDEYRRIMEFDREDRLEEIYRGFIALRKAHSALTRGSFETLIADGRVYGFRRAYENDTVTVILNAGDEDYGLNIDGRILHAKNYTNGIIKKAGYVILG